MGSASDAALEFRVSPERGEPPGQITYDKAALLTKLLKLKPELNHLTITLQQSDTNAFLRSLLLEGKSTNDSVRSTPIYSIAKTLGFTELTEAETQVSFNEQEDSIVTFVVKKPTRKASAPR